MTTVVQPPQQPSSDEHEQLLRGQDLVSSGATFAAGSHVQLSFAAAAAAAAPVQPQPRHTTALSAINESVSSSSNRLARPAMHCARRALPVLTWACPAASAAQTKWVVSAAVFVVLVWQRNEHTAWCVVGAVMSSFLCKVRRRSSAVHCSIQCAQSRASLVLMLHHASALHVLRARSCCVHARAVAGACAQVLKYAINQQRPEQARKSDPGMPSSHANSAWRRHTACAIASAHIAQPVPALTSRNLALTQA